MTTTPNPLGLPSRSFSRAIELDSRYALAYAWRASAIWTLPIAEGNSSDRVQAHFQSARRDAEQAISLAPDLPEGHASWDIC